MRYFFQKKQKGSVRHGEEYYCGHPLYNSCTLYSDGEKGLAIIQQRFDPLTKRSWWTMIDRELVDDIYERTGFLDFFDKYAKPRDGTLYPTVTVRQIMWALRMKPLKKQPWETVFDHKPI